MEKSIKASYEKFVNSLSSIYDEGEARSIARIVFEDAFRLFDFSSDRPFLHIEKLSTIQERLLQCEPVQYVLEQADFYGLKFKVTPDVLIPRSETEELVHRIIQQNHLTVPHILDIGTGSGCIPITLKKKIPQALVTAIDISESALAIAQENAQKNQVDISFFKLDILEISNWTHLPKCDIIVSNPPYIPYKEQALMPAWVSNFEPSVALFVEDTAPLLFYHTIGDFSLHHLKNGGYLFFETNEFNANAVANLLEQKGFQNIILEKDLYGKQRFVIAQLAKRKFLI